MGCYTGNLLLIWFIHLVVVVFNLCDYGCICNLLIDSLYIDCLYYKYFWLHGKLLSRVFSPFFCSYSLFSHFDSALGPLVCSWILLLFFGDDDVWIFTFLIYWRIWFLFYPATGWSITEAFYSDPGLHYVFLRTHIVFCMKPRLCSFHLWSMSYAWD